MLREQSHQDYFEVKDSILGESLLSSYCIILLSYLLYKTLINLQKLWKLKHYSEINQRQSIVHLIQVNTLLGITTSLALTQYLVALVYLITQNTSQNQFQIIFFYLILMLRYTFYYILLSENAYLWYKASQDQASLSQKRQLYSYVRILIIFIIVTINILNTIAYIKNISLRWVQLLILTIFTMIIFISTIRSAMKFIMAHKTSQIFLNRIKICNVCLYISIMLRIVYFLIYIVLTCQNNDAEQYDIEKFIDRGWMWVFLQAMYQTIAALLPLYYLMLLLSPQIQIPTESSFDEALRENLEFLHSLVSVKDSSNKN